jgi:hypothetical protein
MSQHFATSQNRAVAPAPAARELGRLRYPQLLSYEQACEAIQLRSKRTIRNMVLRGEVPPIYFSDRVVRIDSRDLAIPAAGPIEYPRLLTYEQFAELLGSLRKPHGTS